jgi:stress response protein SCP2
VNENDLNQYSVEIFEIIQNHAPTNSETISFVVTIHDAEARRQNFGQVRNAYVLIFDVGNNEEIVKADLMRPSPWTSKSLMARVMERGWGEATKWRHAAS